MQRAALQLPVTLAEQIVAHALDGCPEEVCGLISGRDRVALQVHRGRNVSPTPLTAYELDVETLALQIRFEEAGLELVAIYHSHPAGPAAPSPTDIARAAYPGVVHIICSLAGGRPRLRGFAITDGQVSEVLIETASP